MGAYSPVEYCHSHLLILSLLSTNCVMFASARATSGAGLSPSPVAAKRAPAPSPSPQMMSVDLSVLRAPAAQAPAPFDPVLQDIDNGPELEPIHFGPFSREMRNSEEEEDEPDDDYHPFEFAPPERDHFSVTNHYPKLDPKLVSSRTVLGQDDNRLSPLGSWTSWLLPLRHANDALGDFLRGANTRPEHRAGFGYGFGQGGHGKREWNKPATSLSPRLAMHSSTKYNPEEELDKRSKRQHHAPSMYAPSKSVPAARPAVKSHAGTKSSTRSQTIVLPDPGRGPFWVRGRSALVQPRERTRARILAMLAGTGTFPARPLPRTVAAQRLTTPMPKM